MTSKVEAIHLLIGLVLDGTESQERLENNSVLIAMKGEDLDHQMMELVELIGEVMLLVLIQTPLAKRFL